MKYERDGRVKDGRVGTNEIDIRDRRVRDGV